ncbi:hypothetical protein [Streptomyces sp. NPDC051561]|uniref:hypothetical protein n=1 Tax=Streptomyces sp. NPDC051561 TaxID=3365658 RepID=UPI0037B78E69
MTAAGGLALIIIGAILKFAITWQPRWVNLDVLGTIFMVGGAIGLAIGMLMTFTRRRRQDRGADAQHVYEQRYYDDPPRP